MRKSASLIGLVILGSLLGDGINVEAQNPQLPSSGAGRPQRRPAISPYLDLQNRQNSPAFNYFRRVRPELEHRRANNILNRRVNRLQGQIGEQLLQSGQSRLGTTGHTTRFLNYGRYFPQLRPR